MRLGEITDITFLTPQRMSFVLRLRQSFPEDCARLKPELCHGQPGGNKGNDNRVKNEGLMKTVAEANRGQ